MKRWAWTLLVVIIVVAGLGYWLVLHTIGRLFSEL